MGGRLTRTRELPLRTVVFWLHLTAGVTVGSNVLDRGDWMAGVYLGAHSRAFAGTR